MSTPSVGLERQEPWTRHGWLVWAPWMVFLIYPLTASLQADDRWRLVLGLVATIGFAAAYAVGIRAAMPRESPTAGDFAALLALLVLVGAAAAAVPAIGLVALSFSPFLIAFATFCLPRPWNWRFDAVVLAVALAMPFVTDELEEWGAFLVILVAVTGGTVAGRLMADRGAEVSRVNEELTIASERERVARDVHDVLGHSLTVVAVKVELASRLVDADPERARAELREVQDLSRQALAEIRATVGGLRAAPLADEIAAAQGALTAAGVDCQVAGEVAELDPRRRAVAGWVVREAVTNVVRHARAGHCEIGLSADRLWIRDDGVGGVSRDAHGNGLQGIADRVRGSGGRLDVRPAEDGGTLLEVRW